MGDLFATFLSDASERPKTTYQPKPCITCQSNGWDTFDWSKSASSHFATLTEQQIEQYIDHISKQRTTEGFPDHLARISGSPALVDRLHSSVLDQFDWGKRSPVAILDSVWDELKKNRATHAEVFTGTIKNGVSGFFDTDLPAHKSEPRPADSTKLSLIERSANDDGQAAKTIEEESKHVETTQQINDYTSYILNQIEEGKKFIAVAVNSE